MQEQMNKRRLGTDKETMAKAYLEARGFQVVERNYRCRQGEVDLIARHEGYLVFVEVKYRKTRSAGAAWEAVGITKQRKICRVAEYYALTHGMGTGEGIRYDVLAIQGEEILWIPNAFPHHYHA